MIDGDDVLRHLRARRDEIVAKLVEFASIGSRHLGAFLREHAALLAAEVVVSADGAMWRIDEPSLTVASRGLCGLEVWTRLWTILGEARA